MKFKDIIADANSNLLRSKSRTILTIIAIFIGAMTLTITNGIGAGVSSYIDKQLGNFGADDALVIQPNMEDMFGGGPKKYEPTQGPSSSLGGLAIPVLKSDDIEKIEAVDGVNDVEPVLSAAPDYVSGPNGDKYQLNLSAMITGMNLTLAAGSSPDNSSEQNEIALPKEYPDVLGFSSPESAVGKEVVIGITSADGKSHEIKAEVTGVQDQTLMSLGGALVNDELMRNLSSLQSEGMPESAKDSYMAAVARVSKDISPAELQEIKDELKEKGYAAQTVKDQIGQFKQVISAITMVLNAFAILALVAAGFGIVNTLLMAVQERTKEIGLMKAMGLSGKKIFLLFSIEAILLGFWGSLFGSLVGIGIGLAANQYASESFLKDLPGFELTVFSPISVLVIMAIIMSIAFVAGTIPARRASRKHPIEALRYE